MAMMSDVAECDCKTAFSLAGLDPLTERSASTVESLDSLRASLMPPSLSSKSQSRTSAAPSLLNMLLPSMTSTIEATIPSVFLRALRPSSKQPRSPRMVRDVAARSSSSPDFASRRSAGIAPNRTARVQFPWDWTNSASELWRWGATPGLRSGFKKRLNRTESARVWTVNKVILRVPARLGSYLPTVQAGSDSGHSPRPERQASGVFSAVSHESSSELPTYIVQSFQEHEGSRRSTYSSHTSYRLVLSKLGNPSPNELCNNCMEWVRSADDPYKNRTNHHSRQGPSSLPGSEMKMKTSNGPCLPFGVKTSNGPSLPFWAGTGSPEKTSTQSDSNSLNRIFPGEGNGTS
ncbi:hypothetical protein CRG98_005465 [Punica granatum]|uniref:Uncharacterized protein n=1 Tax=Punica granatum TaxID=22663 RepID=A0A2I0L1V8_PUNGR|nr:hypothetical protein CRG98_005465 [Punica granatum]